VQSDIATKVAQALGGALGAGEEKRLAEKPTQNLAAYDAFLKGEELKNSGVGEPASLRKEIGFYDQAVALDPGFAQAWAGLSGASALLYSNSTPVPALAERARQTGEKAVSLAPNRPEGYLALATYQRIVAHDNIRALEQSEKGLRLAPGDASALRQTALAESGL
jgi:adenylate cyclase